MVSALYFARFDASFISLRAKSLMAKSALPMLTLTNTVFQASKCLSHDQLCNVMALSTSIQPFPLRCS